MVIRGGDDVPFAEVVKVLAALKKVGVQHVTFAAKTKRKAISWEKFSLTRLKKLRERKTAVIVFCRADWCLTCATMERTLFTDKKVVGAISDGKAVALLADFTEKPSKDMQKFFDEQASSEVPTILIFAGKGATKPKILRGIVSPTQLLDALGVKQPKTKSD